MKILTFKSAVDPALLAFVLILALSTGGPAQAQPAASVASGKIADLTIPVFVCDGKACKPDLATPLKTIPCELQTTKPCVTGDLPVKPVLWPKQKRPWCDPRVCDPAPDIERLINLGYPHFRVWPNGIGQAYIGNQPLGKAAPMSLPKPLLAAKIPAPAVIGIKASAKADAPVVYFVGVNQ